MKSSELADCKEGDASPIHSSRVTRRAFVKRSSILTVATSSLVAGLIHTAAGDEEDTTVTTGTTTGGTTGAIKMSCTAPASGGQTVTGNTLNFQVNGYSFSLQVQLETNAVASTAKVPSATYWVKARALRPGLSNSPDETLSWNVACNGSTGIITQGASGNLVKTTSYQTTPNVKNYKVKVETEITFPDGKSYTGATLVAALVKAKATVLVEVWVPQEGGGHWEYQALEGTSETEITVEWTSDAHVPE